MGAALYALFTHVVYYHLLQWESDKCEFWVIYQWFNAMVGDITHNDLMKFQIGYVGKMFIVKERMYTRDIVPWPSQHLISCHRSRGNIIWPEGSTPGKREDYQQVDSFSFQEWICEPTASSQQSRLQLTSSAAPQWQHHHCVVMWAHPAASATECTDSWWQSSSH